MTARRVRVLRIPTSGPDDVGGLTAAFDDGTLRPDTVCAVMGKTEGNGCVNDFTRGWAAQSIARLLAERLSVSIDDVARRVALVMSGGTEGGLSPHLTVFACDTVPAAGPSGARLALGTAFTRAFLPEEIGRMAQVEATAEAVRAAMRDAAIDRPEDVHFVQIKCPLLTKERIAEAAARGQTTATTDTYASMAYSRGASSLGIAVALGEVAAVDDEAICRDWSLYSGCASASAGIELLHNEVLVLGNSERWGGDLRIAHAVMNDAIDLDAAQSALGQLGIAAQGQVKTPVRQRIAAVLAKAESARSGLIRGRRHIMLDDSDIQATRHARALVGGVLAGLIGDTCLYVSGGAEHQGPDGGGPVAVIAHV